MSFPLSIAIVSREYPPFYGGGIGTYARWIVPALADVGVRVHVITQAYDRTHPRTSIDGRVTVHRIPVGMGKGGWPNAALRFSIQAGRLVSTLYRQGRIGIAEFAECEAGAFALLGLGRERPPVIVQLHTPSEQLFVLRSLSTQTMDVPHRIYFESERLAMHLADEILAPSHFIADWAHEQFAFPRKPTVIPYATGVLPAPPDSSCMNDDAVVFYAGRIEPRKGVESLILGFNAVAREHPNASLRLAGGDTSGAPEGGSMRAYLEELIEPHARGRVQFLGRLDREELDAEYARASLCVIPSLWENFPNVCIESMSSARAVLVSDQGGMREMVGDTRGGETFRAGDVDDLARAMRSMLRESRQELVERGEVARARIESMCHPKRIAEARIAHAHQVIDRNRSSRIKSTGNIKSAWVGIERALENEPHTFELPPITDQLAKWVEREEACVC